MIGRRKIWKYQITPKVDWAVMPYQTTFSTPHLAYPVHIGILDSAIYAWMEFIDQDREKTQDVKFWIYGTGMPQEETGIYVATLLDEGRVWHVYWEVFNVSYTWKKDYERQIGLDSPAVIV